HIRDRRSNGPKRRSVENAMGETAPAAPRGSRGRSLRLAAAGVVDPALHGARIVQHLAGSEEKVQFTLGRLGAVGAVDQVEGVADAEVAADGAGLGLGAEG